MNTDLTPAPTPRVDAEACNPHNLCLENNKADYRGRKDEIVDEVVSASFARGLERELLAAHKTAEEFNKLHDYCRAYIAKQAIHSAETINQCDWVIQSAYEFIEGVCEIVGYHKLTDKDSQNSQ